MTQEEKGPLVSVVMATYNGGKYLTLQIESIIQQDYRNFELVIVDDCSSDNTQEIINKYSAEHSYIRVVTNEKNVGYIKNFEKAMLLASGSLIALSDQDDIWDKRKLSVLVSCLGSHEMVYCNSTLIDEEGKPVGKILSDIRHQLSFTDPLMLAIGSTVHGNTMLFKKEVVERCIPFPLVCAHDFWLAFIAACKGEIKYIDQSLVLYRQHRENVFGIIKVEDSEKSKQKEKNQEEIMKIRKRMSLQYRNCPDTLFPQKEVFKNLNESYTSFSLKNNLLRMSLFFKYRDIFLAYKNKTSIGRLLFCFKMFYKVK